MYLLLLVLHLLFELTEYLLNSQKTKRIQKDIRIKYLLMKQVSSTPPYYSSPRFLMISSILSFSALPSAMSD